MVNQMKKIIIKKRESRALNVIPTRFEDDATAIINQLAEEHEVTKSDVVRTAMDEFIVNHNLKPKK